MKKQTVLKVLLYALFILLAAIIILPLAWMFLNSLKTNKELFQNSLALPEVPQLATGLRHGSRDFTGILEIR